MKRGKPDKIQKRKKKLTPNWKRPLTCAIFLPGSSAKNKTVQMLVQQQAHAGVFRLQAAAPPGPWAGEIPRPELPAPLPRGRATPQLCAGELLAAPAPPPGPPRRRRPLCWRARVECCLVGLPPREGARVSSRESPAPERRIPQVGSAASPLQRPRPPALQLCSRRDRSLSAPGSALPRPGKPPRAGLPERGASGHLTAGPVNQR